MRVLVIKTSSLGDVIHTLPAVSDAASQVDARFDWVVEESFAEVPGWHGSVERVIPVAIRRWRKSPLEAWRSKEWQQFKRCIQEKNYDAVIDAQGLVKSAWLTHYAKGPSYGLNRDSAKEPLASRFYNHPVAISKEQHAVERIRQLFAKSLGYKLPDGDGDYRIERAQLPSRASQEKYLVFLHGTTRTSKYWPENYWHILANRLACTNLKILLPWGNDEEKQRAERIARKAANASLLPRSDLRTLAGILAEAQTVVSVDTGLAHLTAALGTPNITMYGPTSPTLVGTYGANQIHLQARAIRQQSCSDKESQLMQVITPEIVLEHLSPLLNRDPV